MILKPLGVLVLVGLVALLARRCRPTRFGLLFGLFLLYVPLAITRLPLSGAPFLNGLTIAFGVLGATLLSAADRPPLGRRAAAFFTAAVVYLVISILAFVHGVGAGADLGASVILLKRWMDSALFGLLALWLRREEDVRFALGSMMLGYAMVALHSVREGWDYGPLKRIPGLLGQPNETGAFLATYAPVIIAVALLGVSWRVRPLLLAPIPMAAAGLMYTESRGAMLAFAVGILVALLASRRTVFAGIGVVLVVGTYMAPDILPHRVVARFESTIQEDHSEAASTEETLEPSAADRVVNWEASLKALTSNPLGSGFTRFKAVIAKYGGIGGLDAHNFFLLVAVELGFLGLAGLAAVLGRVTADAVRLLHSPDLQAQAFGVGVLAMLFAAVVVNLFGSRLMQDGPSTYFWVIAGVNASAADGLSKPIEVSPNEIGQTARAAWWAR